MIVWHYTTGTKLPLILSSGELRPSGVQSPGEKPILWFSRNQVWEPTSAKAILLDNGQRILSKDENVVLCRGLYRFGMQPDRLHPWPKIGRKARMHPRIRHGLELAGYQQGSKPSDWLGTTVAIPLERVTVQFLEEEQWEDITLLAIESQ